jgi:hypothetical protein
MSLPPSLYSRFAFNPAASMTGHHFVISAF